MAGPLLAARCEALLADPDPARVPLFYLGAVGGPGQYNTARRIEPVHAEVVTITRDAVAWVEGGSGRRPAKVEGYMPALNGGAT